MLWNLLLTGFRKIVKLLYSSLDEYEGGGEGAGKGILKLRIDRCISYPLLQHSLRARSQETVNKVK